MDLMVCYIYLSFLCRKFLHRNEKFTGSLDPNNWGLKKSEYGAAVR